VELEWLQQQHLAYLDSMSERGAMILAGPFEDQPDDRGVASAST